MKRFVSRSTVNTFTSQRAERWPPFHHRPTEMGTSTSLFEPQGRFHPPPLLPAADVPTIRHVPKPKALSRGEAYPRGHRHQRKIRALIGALSVLKTYHSDRFDTVAGGAKFLSSVFDEGVQKHMPRGGFAVGEAQGRRLPVRGSYSLWGVRIIEEPESGVNPIAADDANRG
jgi:hypothetical protein